MEALFDLSESLIRRGDSAVLSVYCGEDVTPEEMEQASSYLNEKYGDEIDVDVKMGNQPVYSFLVGVE